MDRFSTTSGLRPQSDKGRLLAFAVVPMLSPGVALAAQEPPPSSPRVACKADFATYCPGVQPGNGRIAACLKEHEAQLSPACKDALAKARERRQAAPATPQN